MSDPASSGAGLPASHHDALPRREAQQSTPSARNEDATNARPAPYDVPDAYSNVDDVHDATLVPRRDEDGVRRSVTREDNVEVGSTMRRDSAGEMHSLGRRRTRRSSGAGDEKPRRASTASSSSAAREARMSRRRSSAAQINYDIPDQFAHLGELADVSPVQNPDEEAIYTHESLEQVRSRDQEYVQDQRTRRRESLASRQGALPEAPAESGQETPEAKVAPGPVSGAHVSRLATQIYTISYLIFFSILGTLARLGLQALTAYPGAPVTFPSIWPNFGGSLVMGFLTEDRMLFRHEWGTPTYENEIRRAEENRGGQGNGSATADRSAVDLAAAKKAHMSTKKTIPLYIGLATGFCGSFTSFSSFIRDVFLALSNNLVAPGQDDTMQRNGGYSFMALIAVVLATVALSLSGLFIGAHLAITLEPYTPSLPFVFTRKLVDRLAVFLAWGSWLGAILLSALPPDRQSGVPETWRGRATFALVFAPLGCLARFYASLYLNGRIASFPLGTFVVNISGTAILGMAWDLAHAELGGIVGCQVFQGIEDGFCGCLTTVSTWAAELATLRRRHAYVYGVLSVSVALAVMIAVMGGLGWSQGFEPLLCMR